jgi:uncharacterized membrane protein YgcG
MRGGGTARRQWQHRYVVLCGDGVWNAFLVHFQRRVLGWVCSACNARHAACSSVVFVLVRKPAPCMYFLSITCAGHSTTAAQAVLDAVSSNLPGGSHTRGDTPAPSPPNYNDPATHASAQAALHPGTMQPSPQQQQQQRQYPAGPAASTSAGSETVSGASDSAESGSGSAGGSGSSGGWGGGASSSVVTSANSDLSNLQVVTELSVNIDAGQPGVGGTAVAGRGGKLQQG